MAIEGPLDKIWPKTAGLKRSRGVTVMNGDLSEPQENQAPTQPFLRPAAQLMWVATARPFDSVVLDTGVADQAIRSARWLISEGFAK